MLGEGQGGDKIATVSKCARKASLVDHFKELQSGWVQKTVELEQNIPEKGVA